MGTDLTGAHWLYLVGLLAILLVMGLRKNPILPAVLFTGLVTWAYTGNPISGVAALYEGSLTAATDLFSIVLIIALITAMLTHLKSIGADTLMVEPIARVMRSSHVAFFVLALGTYALSLFFWPTPAVPLVAAVLIPAAIAAGLRPMTIAMVMAVAGQGMALSSDYVIRVAPELSATASNGDSGQIAQKALVLSLITGLVALTICWMMERRSFARFASLTEREIAVAEFNSGAQGIGGKSTQPDNPVDNHGAAMNANRHPKALLIAILTPAAFLGVVAYMVAAKASRSIPDLEGGQAAALVGGAAVCVLSISTIICSPRTAMTAVAECTQEGFIFAIKVMSIVFPIAGFFFLGNPEMSARIMGMDAEAKAPGFLFDLVIAGQSYLPDNEVILVFGVLLAGMIGGLDGAGFSVLPLTGSLAGAFGDSSGGMTETLAAVGQMGAIWVGGGVLAAWSSVVAVAAFSKVDPVDLTRRLLGPVLIGLLVSTTFATVAF